MMMVKTTAHSVQLGLMKTDSAIGRLQDADNKVAELRSSVNTFSYSFPRREGEVKSLADQRSTRPSANPACYDTHNIGHSILALFFRVGKHMRLEQCVIGD
jgi:hypothetical protein